LLNVVQRIAVRPELFKASKIKSPFVLKGIARESWRVGGKGVRITTRGARKI